MSEEEKENKNASTVVRPENIRVVRLGHGANCSSVGSVVDTLFVASAVGAALFAAVCAALNDRPETKEDAPANDEASSDSANAT